MSSARTFIPIEQGGAVELASFVCSVSAGEPSLLLPNGDVEQANEVVRCLNALHLSLPSKRIELTANCPVPKSNFEGVPLGYLMAVLAAVCAVPVDQVEHSCFDALVYRGGIKPSGNDPLKVSAMVAEADMTLWCAFEGAVLAGLIGNSETLYASRLTDVTNHCLGRRLVDPVWSEIDSVKKLAQITTLKNLQTYGAGANAAPIFDIGSVTCTFRGGQIFVLKLEQSDVL